MTLKNTFKLGLSIVVAISLAACGGGKKESKIAKVKPDKIEISGDVSGFLQVVDNEYEVTDNWGGHLSIKVKAIKAMPAEALKDKNIKLSASILAENGMPISGVREFELEYHSIDKLVNLLKKGTGEEVIELKTLLGGYRAEEHADKAKKFTVSSTIKDFEKTTDTEKVTTPDKSVSSTGNGNWDKTLDDYDAYVNSYIKLLKKAQKGDASAISEYPAMLEKAQSLQSKLEEAKGDLSQDQLSRLLKIQTKITQAAIDMQK